MNVRIMAGGVLGDEQFVSAAEDDLPANPGQLLTEVLPPTLPRRGTSRSRRPSVLGFGTATNAKALAAMLAMPKGANVPPSAAPGTKAKSPAKTTSSISSEKELLAQLVSAVSSLGDRLTSLEGGQAKAQ
eukprot:882743-Amphidinium_carterae.1